jgi:hypothetical protein
MAVLDPKRQVPIGTLMGRATGTPTTTVGSATQGKRNALQVVRGEGLVGIWRFAYHGRLLEIFDADCGGRGFGGFRPRLS